MTINSVVKNASELVDELTSLKLITGFIKTLDADNGDIEVLLCNCNEKWVFPANSSFKTSILQYMREQETTIAQSIIDKVV